MKLLTILKYSTKWIIFLYTQESYSIILRLQGILHTSLSINANVKISVRNALKLKYMFCDNIVMQIFCICFQARLPPSRRNWSVPAAICSKSGYCGAHPPAKPRVVLQHPRHTPSQLHDRRDACSTAACTAWDAVAHVLFGSFYFASFCTEL